MNMLKPITPGELLLEEFLNFRLTKEEKAEVVTNCDHIEKLKFSPVTPRVFTEHGAIMAASVLNSWAADWRRRLGEVGR